MCEGYTSERQAGSALVGGIDVCRVAFAKAASSRRTPKLRAGADAHAVEGTIDEEERDGEEGGGQEVRQAFALRGG